MRPRIVERVIEIEDPGQALLQAAAFSLESASMQLSRNFSLAQLTKSETAEKRGIDNSPPPEILGNLKLLAAGLEQILLLLGAPIEISSGYRCPELNAAVGGAAGSQHTLGLAVDFICPGFGSPLEIARAIRGSNMAFDQCILEYGEWVHLSFALAPRQRVLTIYDSDTGYIAGLWDRDGTQIV
jgi:hypothetical protein